MFEGWPARQSFLVWIAGALERQRANNRRALWLERAVFTDRAIEPVTFGTRLKQMQHIDALAAVLSVLMAACTASYFWIFLYRPAAHRFSIPQLTALAWYKRWPGYVYLVFAGLGLGFMFFNGIEAALWWVPKTWTVWIDGEDRPISWLAALAIGFLSAQFVTSKFEEIAPKISPAKDET
jgi:hypothetical protein